MRRWWGAAAALVLCAGCGPYLHKRLNDAKDMVDFGYTTSKKPYFALYQDYFNLMPHGYSRLEGTFHGVGAYQVGSVPLHDRSWGLLLWGSLRNRVGAFDPTNAHHVSPRTIDALKAAGKPLPTEVSRYNIGTVRMLARDNIPPRSLFYT